MSGQLHALATLTPWKDPGGWVGPRTSLDAGVKKKNPFTAPAGSQTPVIQP
jgi:hypothetical protein